MYFIKKGKKEKYIPDSHGYHKENFVDTQHKENNDKKCPSWVFIFLGILASFISAWLIFSIIKDKNDH